MSAELNWIPHDGSPNPPIEDGVRFTMQFRNEPRPCAEARALLYIQSDAGTWNWSRVIAYAIIPDGWPGEAPAGDGFDFRAHLQRQREWSEKTFGPGPRVAGVIDHIRKELREIEAAPDDLSEWIDVATLALDGAWRSGATPDQIIAQIVAKQTKNEGRVWPDWRTAPPDKAIEHDRSASDA